MQTTKIRYAPDSPKAGNPSALQRKRDVSEGSTSTEPGLFSWFNKQDAQVALILAIATFIVYAQIVGHPFVNYDDAEYLGNPHIVSGLSWQNFRWALTAVAAGNWHPVTWISHALDCQLFGLRAGGHHATSLLLHVINAVVLFLLLKRATGARWRSFGAAALFALHPSNVESVSWVAERKNLLCTLFFLLALGAYGWYARKPGPQRYLCLAIMFLLGLASKPMIVTLPFVLLLMDFWPLRRVAKWSVPTAQFPVPQRSFSTLVLEKLPLLALSGASAVITVIAQRQFDAMPSAAGWTVVWRIQNAIHSYAMYLWKRSFLVGWPYSIPH